MQCVKTICFGQTRDLSSRINHSTFKNNEYCQTVLRSASRGLMMSIDKITNNKPLQSPAHLVISLVGANTPSHFYRTREEFTWKEGKTVLHFICVASIMLIMQGCDLLLNYWSKCILECFSVRYENGCILWEHGQVIVVVETNFQSVTFETCWLKCHFLFHLLLYHHFASPPEGEQT